MKRKNNLPTKREEKQPTDKARKKKNLLTKRGVKKLLRKSNNLLKDREKEKHNLLKEREREKKQPSEKERETTTY